PPALLVALARVPGGPVAAGAVSCLAILPRPDLLPFALVLPLVVANIPRGRDDRRGRFDRLVGFAAGITPAVGAQFLMQWRLYGSPIASGYGSAGDLYALNPIVPNAVGYARRMIHGEGPALALAVAALIVSAIIRTRPAGVPPLKRTIDLAPSAGGSLAAPHTPVAACL